jgi:myo-inositol-1(or 4)-monophosphatase
MPSHSALITVIDRACRKASVRLRRDFNEVAELQVSRKGPADFVSNADRAAELTIREELSRARPGWAMVLEEAGEVAGDPDLPRFIVDPLDGTTNFLHGVPHFAISVAVEHQGELTAAFVYQPLTDEAFWAEKGRGAWLHDRRLRVSARRDLSECLIGTGMPFRGHGDPAPYLDVLGRVMPEVAGVRRNGAAALDLAWVAAGRFDGFFERDLKSWDMAAGLLLIREAGGFATDWRGGERMLDRGEVVAGNTEIQGRLHRLVVGRPTREARQKPEPE